MSSESQFGLTPRQLEIVSAVAAGYNNREIAEYLKISQNTVKGRLREIFETLGVSTRLELALWQVSGWMAQKTQIQKDSQSRNQEAQT